MKRASRTTLGSSFQCVSLRWAVAGLLVAVFSSSAGAAVMPEGSHAWMVWSVPDDASFATSNLVGPNPPNGIPLTSFASPPLGAFGTASAEILPDQMRSFKSGYGSGILYLSMWDTYTVHGSAADPFEITVHLDVSAMGRSVLATTASGVETWGLSHPSITMEIGTFSHTTEELHEQWRVNAFDPSTSVIIERGSQFSNSGPFEHAMEGTVSYSRVVSPGEVFDLAFGVTSATSWDETCSIRQ